MNNSRNLGKGKFGGLYSKKKLRIFLFFVRKYKKKNILPLKRGRRGKNIFLLWKRRRTNLEGRGVLSPQIYFIK